MDERILQAILRFTIDQSGVDRVKSGSSTIRKELEKIQQEANRTREQMERLTGLGVKLAGAGTAISAPLLLSMRAYLQSANQADVVNQRWIASSKQIEDSQARVGRVVATRVVPYMETAAKLAEKLADEAEKHPGVIGAMLGAGAGLVGSGSLITMLSQGIRITADVKFLAAASLMDKAADKMLAAGGEMNAAGKTASGGVIGTISKYAPIVGPLVAMVAVAWAAHEISNEQKAQAIIKNPAAAQQEREMLQRYRAGGVLTPEEQAGIVRYRVPHQGGVYSQEALNQHIDDRIKEIENALARFSEATVSNVDKILRSFDMLSSDRQSSLIKVMQNYQNAETDALQQLGERRKEIEKETEEERNSILEKAGAERVRLETQYEAERTQMIEQENKQEEQKLQDHLRQIDKMRTNAERLDKESQEQHAAQQAKLWANVNQRIIDLNKAAHQQIEQAAIDHNERLRQIELSHTQRVDDLLANRDAIGLARENASYQQQVDEENRQYKNQIDQIKQQLAEQTETAREEYRKQLAEMIASFEEQRSQRKAETDRQIQEQNEQFDIMAKREKDAFDERLKAFDEKHEKEMQQQQDQADEEIRALEQQKRKYLAEAQQKYDEEHRARSTALRNQMNDLLGIEQQGYDKIKEATRSYVDDLLKEAHRLKSSGSSTNATGRLSGGYMYSRQLYQVAENQQTEYVMDNQLTRAAEMAVGGKLNNERLMWALAGKAYAGSIGGSSLQIGSLTVVLPGTNMSEAEIERFMEDKAPGIVANTLRSAAKKVPV